MSAAPDSSPCSIHEKVQSAFAVNDLAVLQDCCADLGWKINAKYRSVPFSAQLLSGVSATKSTNYSLTV
jgi:hypothetical protein